MPFKHLTIATCQNGGNYKAPQSLNFGPPCHTLASSFFNLAYSELKNENFRTADTYKKALLSNWLNVIYSLTRENKSTIYIHLYLYEHQIIKLNRSNKLHCILLTSIYKHATV